MFTCIFSSRYKFHWIKKPMAHDDQFFQRPILPDYVHLIKYYYFFYHSFPGCSHICKLRFRKKYISLEFSNRFRFDELRYSFYGCPLGPTKVLSTVALRLAWARKKYSKIVWSTIYHPKFVIRLLIIVWIFGDRFSLSVFWDYYGLNEFCFLGFSFSFMDFLPDFNISFTIQ